MGKLLREARQHHDAGRLAEAEKCYRRMLESDPDYAAAHFGLGKIASRLKKRKAAYAHFKRATVLKPDDAGCWIGLAQTLIYMGQPQAAAIAYEKAVALKPEDIALLVQAAWSFYLDDRSDKALETYTRALKLDPRHVQALIGKGQQHFALGDVPAARACFREALEIEPGCPLACFRLVDMADDPEELAALIRIAEEAINEDREEEKNARLHFAAAKGYQRQKEYDAAFARFSAGNAIIRQEHPFDREGFRRLVDETIEAFRPEVFEVLADAATDTAQPIFIVGMPRSGSTLVEQIISCHPDVADAGEFHKLRSTAQLLGADHGGGLRYPRDIARFETAPLAELGQDYLNALRREQPDTALRITDKLLSNFLHVGLIAILFPNAAIIHCRRDPMATCLSCYTQMFAAMRDLAYATDLANLGFYYRQYERLMAHWREVLPGRMFDVDYETLVTEQEETSRRLIEHIGLAWDDACLTFYNAKRSVRTASHSQVRRPVYTSSVDGWRRYEKHLGPLKEALEEFASE